MKNKVVKPTVATQIIDNVTDKVTQQYEFICTVLGIIITR